MTKSELKEALPTDEELLATHFVSQPLGDWRPGKKFLVADKKASLILESEKYGDSGDISGHVLIFSGVKPRQTPGGDAVIMTVFNDSVGGSQYLYNTGKGLASADKEVTGLDIPALIDMDMVGLADSIMNGRELWIKTQLWYDRDGNTIYGYKYVPVKIKKVSPGNMLFPLTVEFEYGKGELANVFMNVRAGSGIGAESRTFPTLFSLTDPKDRYPSVSDEMWRLIQSGRVAAGMTKDECRLSLGNPSEVDAGHDWNSTIDIWRYKDGTFLRFQDGLLVDFRH